MLNACDEQHHILIAHYCNINNTLFSFSTTQLTMNQKEKIKTLGYNRIAEAKADKPQKAKDLMASYYQKKILRRERRRY